MVKESDHTIIQQLTITNSYLRELTSYHRRSTLRESLSDADKKKAYMLSDGTRTSPEVKKEGGLSQSARTIRRWWKDWIDLGLAERLEDGTARARYEAWVIDEGDEDG